MLKAAQENKIMHLLAASNAIAHMYGFHEESSQGKFHSRAAVVATSL